MAFYKLCEIRGAGHPSHGKYAAGNDLRYCYRPDCGNAGSLYLCKISFLKDPRFLYLAIMALLMIPGFVLLIPQFIQITRLQMYNTFWGLIFPPAAASSATATFLLRTSMEGLSKSLFEAADMEGAGDLQILTKIVVPLSKPTISTVTIMTGLSAWNNYLWPLVSTTGENTQQIAVALTKLVRSSVEGNGIMFAGYVTASLPLILLFCFASKSFVSGLTQGAVKG